MNKKVSEVYALEGRLASIPIPIPISRPWKGAWRRNDALQTGESVESSDNAGGASMGFNSWIDWSGYRGKESRDDVCLP